MLLNLKLTGSSHNSCACKLSFKKLDASNFEFSIVIKKFHLNSGNIAHGGFLSTVADTGMGTAAHILCNKRCVTISLEIKFLSAGYLNQKLNGKVSSGTLAGKLSRGVSVKKALGK